MADPKPIKKAAPRPSRERAKTQAQVEAEDNVQALTDAAVAMTDQGKALEESIVTTVVRENRSLWRGIVVLAVAVALLLGAQGFQTYRSLFVSGPILSRLDHQSEGIDSLVSFVADVKANTCDPRNPPEGGCPPSEADQIIRLLCASKDSVRRAACKELGYDPVP